MALKADWVIEADRIDLTCETATDRGVVLVHSTAGSGVALGESAGEADLVLDPSGYKVAGMLLNDVVDVDETRYHRNFHKNETMVGERCWLGKRGHVTTDKISGTPTEGATAYVTTSGVLTPTKSTTGGEAATPKFGVFEGIKDENGYCKVSFSLPVIPN